MTWIKLDDKLPNNPKILQLSDKAFRRYVEGLCYANQYLTDGFLANVVIDRLGAEVTQELLQAELWLQADGGIQIHDYCEHQTTRKEVDSKREQTRDRVTRYRNKSNADVTLPETETENIKHIQDSFDEFWEIYPRKAGKQEARKVFKRALSNATLADILAGARRYASDPNREAQYTAHPATWLNQGRWADEPLPPRSPVGRFERVLEPARVPPRYSEEDAPKGSPMPDSVKQLLGRMSEL
jgi:hypothetical protein